MSEGDEFVIIKAGVLCHECLGEIKDQSDNPVVFNCASGGAPHVYHEDCLPEELARIILMKRTAAIN